MLRLTEIRLPLDHPSDDLKTAILRRLGIAASDLSGYTLFRRGYDARKRNAIVLVYTVDVEVNNEAALLKKNIPHVSKAPDMSYRVVAHAPARIERTPRGHRHRPLWTLRRVVAGSNGLSPDYSGTRQRGGERTKDTWGLWRKGKLDPESNVQFGEGGAGTFSDGKLHSQIKDPKFYGRKVLTEFVKAGAPEEIMYVSKPHIGTFRLVGVVEKMRHSIEALGGEIRFQSRVADIEISNEQVSGVVLANGEHFATNHVVLAVGHSARDTFEMLHRHSVYMEAKPFSIGFRIEHPQSVIDRARFGANAGTHCSARPITNLCITPLTVVRYIVFACVPAARWWPRLRKKVAW